ncbi:MAG: adenine phosphoribosyltransferase [Calditrichaceae bacterium]
MDRLEQLKSAIRDVPDFPKKGILFKDITPVLNDFTLFSDAISLLQESIKNHSIDKIAAIESRGFIFGSVLASKIGTGFVPIRKPGKLPYKIYREEYQLEYGVDALEIHQDAVKTNDRVLLVDDLLATGGTALAAAKLIEKCGGIVSEIIFLIELEFLNGRKRISNYPVSSLIIY